MQLSPHLRTAPYLAPAPFAAAAAAANRLSEAAAGSVVASAVATACARGAWECGRAAGRRRRVDRWLAWGEGQPPPDALIGARMHELTSPRERRRLAGSLRAIRDLGLRPGVYRASVVNPRAAAANGPALERLAARLEALEQSVAARGVARTVALLGDGRGPLYDPRRAEDLGPALERALRAL